MFDLKDIQCDQMTRLFVQYLALYNTKKLPRRKEISEIG